MQARIKWLMADKSKGYDDLVASRQRIYRQPGFVAAMRDIMALQDPEIRAAKPVRPGEYGAITAPTLVLWTSDDPTADVGEGRRIASDDSRCAVRGDARGVATGRSTRTPRPSIACKSISCWAADGWPAHQGTATARADFDVLVVGAGPVGLTLANILGLQGIRTLVVEDRRLADRLSARGRTRRRGAAHIPVGRSGRPRPAAHRAKPDSAVLRRPTPGACRNGAPGCVFRLAQA